MVVEIIVINNGEVSSSGQKEKKYSGEVATMYRKMYGKPQGDWIKDIHAKTVGKLNPGNYKGGGK